MWQEIPDFEKHEMSLHPQEDLGHATGSAVVGRPPRAGWGPGHHALKTTYPWGFLPLIAQSAPHHSVVLVLGSVNITVVSIFRFIFLLANAGFAQQWKTRLYTCVVACGFALGAGFASTWVTCLNCRDPHPTSAPTCGIFLQFWMGCLRSPQSLSDTTSCRSCCRISFVINKGYF